MGIDMATGGIASPASSAGQDDSMLEAGASEAGVHPPGCEGERGRQACQLCMSLAPYHAAAVKAITLESSAVDIALAQCFVSAENKRALKPPIS